MMHAVGSDWVPNLPFVEQSMWPLGAEGGWGDPQQNLPSFPLSPFQHKAGHISRCRLLPNGMWLSVLLQARALLERLYAFGSIQQEADNSLKN